MQFWLVTVQLITITLPFISNLLLLLLLSRFSCVRLCETPQTAAHQAPLSLGFSRQNTGVGCHFLLQCMKVKSGSEVAQSCPTLSDPMDCSPPGSPVHGIFQTRGLAWGAVAFSAPISYWVSISGILLLLLLLNRSVTLTLGDPVDCKPARLLYPKNFPGRNTGVGSHFLLQGIFLIQGSNTQSLV